MKLSNLLENPLNRKIDRAKVADIKRAIKTSGVIKPLVYTEVMTDKGKENMLTDGHHRYVALKEMGYKDAPVVMSDERGIETAQFQDMKSVKKAITALRTLSKHLHGQIITKKKKECREGYYRDKDGNCRRRGQRYGYGGGILIHRPRNNKPHNGNGHNGHGTGNGGTPSNGGVTKHLPGQHDQDRHDPTGRFAGFNYNEKTLQDMMRGLVLGMVPALKLKGKIIEGRNRQVHDDIAEDNNLTNDDYAASEVGFVDEYGKWMSREELGTILRLGEEAHASQLIAAQDEYEDLPDKVSKHLQGQHDQSTHGKRGGVRGAISREYRRKPATRREATTRGAVKGGAVHLGTIAIPAVATAAIIRGASYFRFGVIGAGVALVIYEAPQFAFRVIEGSVREKKEFARQSRLKKAEAQTDRANRPISRGDHLLVMYKKGANIGVYIGDGKARLINGPKFEDVRTSKHNRLKIASGRGVPGIEQPNKTKRILRQVKREQEAIAEAVKQIKEKQVTKRSVDKHGSHNQQSHDPTKGRGKKVPTCSPSGTCKDKDFIEDTFGSVSEFARIVEERGDNFSYGKYQVRYDPDTDTHSFHEKVTKRNIIKHPGHPDQKVHGRRGKGKDTAEVKQLRAQLRPAFRVRGKIYAGKRGQIHAEIINQFPRGDKDLTDAVSGFVDAKGNFMTRKQALSRVGQGETVSMRGRTLQDRLEDLESKKVTKHTPGGQEHNQQRHDPTGGRGQGALQQEARSRLRSSGKHKQLRRELNSLASDPNKPGNKERMNEIHQQLAGQAREARSEVRREPKPAIISLNDVKNHLSRGTKVLLSAERSNLPTKENTQRTATLREELQTIGSDITESDSKYSGIREKGFVISISPNKLRNIKQLVEKYKQDSVIVIQDGKAELRYSDGRTEYADVSETRDVEGTDDNYSSIGGVKFTIPFKDRRREIKRKMIKYVNRVRDLLTKVNRLTKEGVASIPVAGLALSRESLQSEMAHPHPGHVKKQDTSEALRDVQEKIYKRLKRDVQKHTPGGHQHDQSTHGRRTGSPSRVSIEDSLIMSIRPAVKHKGRIYIGGQGQLHEEIEREQGLPVFYADERGFVDRRGSWMEREEVGAIIGGDGLSEDLIEEQAQRKPVEVEKAKKQKGWATQDSFRLNQKMNMDVGSNTKRPYKNVEGANVEGGRV